MLTITVYNSHAEMISGSSLEQRNFINVYLTARETQKRMSRGKKKTFKTIVVEHKLYIKSLDREKIIFPRGIVDYIKHLNGIEIIWKCDNNIIIPDLSEEDIVTILQPESGFDLRSDQVIAIKKALHLKRGLIQMPPGSGKTEVQSAILKALFKCNEIKALIIEPTTELSRGVVNRLNNYNLDATFYSEVRTTESKIVVAHVSALLNDLEKNKDLLKQFNVVFFDESHHKICDTWLKLNFALEGVEYSLGFSALAIDEKNTPVDRYPSMTYPEKLVALSTGVTLLHINSSYYMEEGHLSTPIVFQVNNFIDPVIEGLRVWTQLFSIGISSEDRNTRVSEITEVFLKHGRKILILVGTKEQAFYLSNKLLENVRGVGISFGGKESYLDGEKHSDSIVDKFNEGVYNVLLATTHLDEGIDIKNLDVCVLASGGKKDRRLIQRIGRVLRKTKHGKYAYIVDFSDTGNGILTMHSKHRMKLYRELVEIPDDNIYKVSNMDEVNSIFKVLEEIN